LDSTLPHTKRLATGERRERHNDVQDSHWFHLAAILCIVLIALAFLGFAANRWRHSLGISQIDVDGNSILSDNEILELANVADSLGLCDLDLGLMRGNILKQPFIKDVAINREFPSTLRIAVDERRPVAILSNINLLYVDQEGYLLPHTSSKEVFDLPIISGMKPPINVMPGEKIESARLQAALEIFSVAKEVDEELYHFISEVNLNDGSDILIYSTQSGMPIIFGEGEVRRKMVYLDAFLKQHARSQGPENITYVDLRFDKQVVVRWATSGPAKETLSLLPADQNGGQQ
jgi:cell division protein FtsQ